MDNVIGGCIDGVRSVGDDVRSGCMGKVRLGWWGKGGWMDGIRVWGVMMGCWGMGRWINGWHKRQVNRWGAGCWVGV